MKYIFIIVAFLFLFSCKKDRELTYPVSIVAGDSIGVGVLYTKLPIPDTLYYSKYESAVRVLDINHDHQDDIEIEILYFATPGSSYFSSKITPLNGSELAAPVSDSTCIDTLNYGVIVNENIFWSKAAFDLSSLSGDWNGFTSHGLWAWARDKYVGIRLNVSGRKYYGWLGMEYSEVNFHTLVIIEYASTIGY